MKIVSLQAENIKKLKAVEIKPSGEIVTIAGRNGQGKTSVLDSIWWALAGTSHIQIQPIRQGQKKARIKLDLGELIVERKFSESGSTLVVENTDGARFPSPQKMLDALLGALSFDPLAFARMDPKKQFDELRQIAHVEIDLDSLDRLNSADYAKRTEVNREAKAKKAQADGIVLPDKLPAKPIDESTMIDEIEKAGQRSLEIQRIENANEAHRQAAIRYRNEALKLDARVRELTTQIVQAQNAMQVALDAADQADADVTKELPAPIDVSEIRKKLEQAKTVNADIAKRTERDEILKEHATLLKQSEAITETMNDRLKIKMDALAAAEMPIAGLGLGEGCVTFNGVPLEQSSSAEQLRVSLAIAMAANPKLRVIRITDGSLLDEDSLAAIAEIAKAEDYQVWIERVDSTGKVGIVIDDGAVVAVNEEAVPA